MTDICIQIQPDRAQALDLDSVCECAAAFAAQSPLGRRFAVVPGEGFCNLMFDTAAPVALWAALSNTLYDDPRWGASLRRCAMAMCEGAQGWDDYLLLQHYDENQALDRLS